MSGITYYVYLFAAVLVIEKIAPVPKAITKVRKGLAEALHLCRTGNRGNLRCRRRRHPLYRSCRDLRCSSATCEVPAFQSSVKMSAKNPKEE